MARRHSASSWLAFSILFIVSSSTPLSGCGDDDSSPDAGDSSIVIDSTIERDGTVDSGPDAMVECTQDSECDDEVECTRDTCNGIGRCTHAMDFAVCDDGVFCNGVEICDGLEGCLPGPPETCSDDDVCTIDRCDEETKSCEHLPRDFDGDGEADWHCEGGTDCDDRDPGRGSLVSEICDDTIDNDCDDVTDEAECGRPAHDLCEDALDVSAGGTFEVDTRGATHDYSLTCSRSTRKDIVLTFTLAEARDVFIEADGRSSTYLGLRTSCTDRDTETDCSGGFPGTLRARALAAGTYFVVVQDLGGDLVLDVSFTAPTEPPTNDTCASPIDVSAAGTFTGSLVDIADDTTLSCSFGALGDLFYSFTITETQDVLLSLRSLTDDTISLAVRSTCDGMDPMDGSSTDLRCARGRPAATRLRSLAPGTYYAVVEGTTRREIDFELTVSFAPPTATPAGESCDTAIPLALGVPMTSTLTGMEDDHDLTCSFSPYADMVYSFAITERSDVLVTADGGRSMYVSVRPECDTTAGRLRCVSGSPSRVRLRDLAAGTYYVIVESYRAGSFTIEAVATPPTISVPVSGNEACDTAHVVPASGGLFTGDTSTMLNDLESSPGCGAGAASPDAVFRLDLAVAKHVVATTDGSAFDTVLHVHRTACTSGAELVCDDDGGEASRSRIDRELAAGTYYFVVDGFASSSSGAYTFEVVVSDPSP